MFSSNDERATCVCLRYKKVLAFEKRQLLGVVHVLLLCSVASYRGSEYACVHACHVDRSELLESAAQSSKSDLCVLASSSCRELLGSAGTRGRPMASLTLPLSPMSLSVVEVRPVTVAWLQPECL